MPDWTEEEIAAHVDGSLDPAKDAAIRRAIETDPEARAIAERLRSMNRLISAAFPLPPPHHLPPAIARHLRTASAGQAKDARQVDARAWLLLIFAASVSIVVLAGVGLFHLQQRAFTPETGSVHLADAETPLREALERLASGTLSDDGVRPLATFRDRNDRFCREFETSGAVARAGIACRAGSGEWELVTLVVLPQPDGVEGGEQYAPASGTEGVALDTALDALDAGLPLSPEREAGLLATGWR